MVKALALPWNMKVEIIMMVCAYCLLTGSQLSGTNSPWKSQPLHPQIKAPSTSTSLCSIRPAPAWTRTSTVTRNRFAPGQQTCLSCHISAHSPLALCAQGKYCPRELLAAGRARQKGTSKRAPSQVVSKGPRACHVAGALRTIPANRQQSELAFGPQNQILGGTGRRDYINERAPVLFQPALKTEIQ